MRHETVPAVVEALLEGRARIEAGWCQFFPKLETPDCLGGPQYCALGAVGPFIEGGLPAAILAGKLLHSALPTGWTQVSAYNDDGATKKAGILALYDRAIEIALAQ